MRITRLWSAAVLLVLTSCGDSSSEVPDSESEQELTRSWRSSLYPASWRPLELDPNARDAAGRVLPDFSWAGYHRGELRPPYGRAPVVVAVSAELGKGSADATGGIQAAIDSACAKPGGGAVFIPAGLYRLSFPAGGQAALSIACSNVVLRGAGRNLSRLLLADVAGAAGKAVIRLGGRGSVRDSAQTRTFALDRDELLPTRVLRIAATTQLEVGSAVAIHQSLTPAFRAEHRMDNVHTKDGDFWPADLDAGRLYVRRIAAVQTVGGRTYVTLDQPTRLALRVRDNARIYALPGLVRESGVEDLGIGMAESLGIDGRDVEQAASQPGTMGNLVSGSKAVLVDYAMDTWLYRVDSFKPQGNQVSHVASHGIALGLGSARSTIEDCRFAQPAYRGAGGNGYLFVVAGQDHLFVETQATGGRHNYLLNSGVASGNVFWSVVSNDSVYASDSHQYLSHQNLYDGLRQRGSWLQAVNRGHSSGLAGFTATEQVFWGVKSSDLPDRAAGCAVETGQFGHGYVIGTSGVGEICRDVRSQPYWATIDQDEQTPDWIEGFGKGKDLLPASLYLDQRRKRCDREGLGCTIGWPGTGAKLSDANATEGARKLFSYLQEVYGRNTLSGISSSENASEVLSVTGKGPAVVGGDMSGWNLPPGSATWSNSLKKSRQELIASYAAGAIITVTWHWPNPFDYTLRAWSKLTDVQWDRMLRPGTAENATLLADIDRYVENYLKLLVDPDGQPIPVLFRPLHEIDGGWFWWTNKAHPEKTVELYKLLYARITGHHNLHNLIWIWNNSVAAGRVEGDSSGTVFPDVAASYYPGSAYADIVGWDAYGIDYQDTGVRTLWNGKSQSYASYFELLGQIAPGKMRALCEGEAMPNPDLTVSGNANFSKWLYAMAWYAPDEVFNGCFTKPCHPRAWAQQTYGHGWYLTRDEVSYPR